MAPLAIQKTSRRPSFFGTSMAKSFRRVWAGSGDVMIMLIIIKIDLQMGHHKKTSTLIQ
jgi:hypothetical protein